MRKKVLYQWQQPKSECQQNSCLSTISTFRFCFLPKKSCLSAARIRVKKHTCFKANQGDDSLILLPEKPKPQFSVYVDPKKFST